MENVIEIKNIRKSYPIGDSLLEVLKGISLTVKNGEFIAVLGPSGSGKSTLMNVIGCMDGFDSGDYFLDGEAIRKMNDSKMTKIRNSKIGFIFQKYHLINKYSVLRNVEIPLLLRGYSQKEASEAAAQKES